jgi:hypothetical protein
MERDRIADCEKKIEMQKLIICTFFVHVPIMVGRNQIILKPDILRDVPGTVVSLVVPPARTPRYLKK